MASEWRDVPGYDGLLVTLTHSLPSDVSAISPFVDNLMTLIRSYGCAPEVEFAIETATREALANAIVHGNREDPGRYVYVTCRCEAGQEVSIVVWDQGRGFDANVQPDPTTSLAVKLNHGRGIYLMKALMDDVWFERGGTVVRMRKGLRRDRHAVAEERAIKNVRA